jgi:iron(III) transport system permease protein
MLMAAFTLAIYATIFWGAFVKAWGMNNTLTLENFRYVFDVGLEAIKDTLIIAFTSTPISALLGMVIAFLLVRKLFPGRKLMEFTSLLSFAVPGTVIGIGYILAFNTKPFLLTGTLAILVLNFVFRYVPVGIQSGVACSTRSIRRSKKPPTRWVRITRQVFTRVTLTSDSSRLLLSLGLRLRTGDDRHKWLLSFWYRPVESD